MMPALEVFSTLEREILESIAGCQDKLKIDGTGEKPQKKAWTQNMNKYKKFILIQKYYEHKNKYYALNKTKF